MQNKIIFVNPIKMHLQQALSKLINKGTSHVDSIEDIRAIRMVNIYTLFAIPICMGFTINSILLENTFTAISTCCYVIIFIIIYRVIQYKRINAIRSILFFASFIPVFINREAFETSVYFQILLLAITVAYSLVLKQKGILTTLIYTTLSVFLIYLAGTKIYFTNLPHISQYQSIHESVMFWQSMIIIMLSIHIYWYETNRIIRLQSATNDKLDRSLLAQKEMFNALNWNKMFYEGVLNKLESEVAVFDSECRYIYLNPAIESSKEKRDAIIGKKIGSGTAEYECYNIKNTRIIKKRADIIKQCLISKRSYTTEETIFDKQQQQKHIIRQFIYVKNNHDSAEQVLTLGVNITEIKNMQEDLIRTKDEAMVAAKAKQHFMSVMSHEMRTPLNAVIGLSNLIISNSKDHTQIQNLETLKFSANSLLTIIDDILDFNDLEFGNITIEKSSFKLKKLIYNIISILKDSAKAKNLPLLIEIHPDVPNNFYGDQYRLSQILSNLLNNAIKFTNKGFVKLSVEYNTESNRIIFKTIDTGIGIETQKLESIFKSFQQANVNIKRKYGGTGLGLTISKKIADLMKAQLCVKSELGKGSTFTLTLPNEHHVISKPIHPLNAYKNLKHIHILLVEDNEVNQMVAQKFLTKWNAKVTIANHGKEALKLIDNQAFNIILMDLHMPIMDGFEAILSLKTNPLFNTPIIVLSADISENSAFKTKQLNIQDVIYKPFEPEDLYFKIKQHI